MAKKVVEAKQDTFEYEGATISTRVVTIGDDEDIYALMALLNDDTRVNRAVLWASFVIDADIKGAAPIPIVTLDATEEEARASYAAWRALPLWFAQRWDVLWTAAGGEYVHAALLRVSQ